jgi:hypothetical protein
MSLVPHKRGFADHREFVRFGDEHKLRLDFIKPPNH